jgi:hypothetical protein
LLQIIVLEDRPEYMSKVEKTELKEMERKPFDLIVSPRSPS